MQREFHELITHLFVAQVNGTAATSAAQSSMSSAMGV